MISITMLNKTIKKVLYVLIAVVFWILIFEVASILINDNLKLFLPSPFAVFYALLRLLRESYFWKSVFFTLIRIFTGFVCGTIGGIVLGVLTSHICTFNILFSPAMRIIRAVPVVSFIILAYLFINVNYLPIFICFLMVMPLVWQTVHDQLTGFDRNLLEMAKVFNITGYKSLFFIKLTGISDKIVSTMINGIGLAWKSGIATEVLCTPIISLGRNLYRAKGNINYDEVYAITLTVVILSLIIEYLIKHLYTRKDRLEKQYD